MDLNNKTVAILSNDPSWTYNLRYETIITLLQKGYRVCLLVGYGDILKPLIDFGCEFYNVPFDRHGMNIYKDSKLILSYYKILRRIKPDFVLSYTIKPNLYGGIVCEFLKIPYIANITGLGTAIENGGFLKKILTVLYRIAFVKVKRVFVQNEENKQYFIDNHIAVDKLKLIPGSGVNVKRFYPLEYPTEEVTIEFAFISRIMKEKGIDQYLEAAKTIKEKYPNTVFHVCGFCEPEYEGCLKEFADKGIVVFHGMVREIETILKKVSCVIHPTYYPEGISNVLLESAASARPIITTNRSGCREVIDNGINGFIVEQKNTNDLIKKIEIFLSLSHSQRKKMGLAGRKKVETTFDRQIVVEAYLEEIK